MIRRSILALGSALALALTASAPAYAGSAQPTAAYDTNVTADAKPEPVAKNRTLTVTGSLKYKRSGTWRPMSARAVTIHFDPSGTAGSRKVATVRTNSNGVYTYRTTATRSGKWIVRYQPQVSTYQPDVASDAVCVYSAGRWQCPVSPTNPDLDCADIGRTVWVGTNDYHDLDRDNDGWGCDSYS
ncbi:hypothetical protein ACO229_01865 [Promicromonospora sp. MS192]|uniref:hypothetical protein n=1 Tax=Promicromonospora sp. MS192 TaxID=3412684 RepID=UPI003C30C4DE